VMKLLPIVLALFACSKKEATSDVTPAPQAPAQAKPVAPQSPPAPPPSPPPPDTMSADARAYKILDAQLAALRAGGDAIVPTFAPDAIVLVPDARAAKTAPMLRDAIVRTSPHEQVADIKIVKLVAGQRDGAVWWSGELAITMTGGEPQTGQSGGAAHVRVTELATVDADWKVVAAAFSEPSKPSMQRAAPDSIPSTTDAGPISALAANAKQLDAALADDPSLAVFGTDPDEVGYGKAAAHALVAKWAGASFALQGKPRELHGKTWGLALQNVDLNVPGDKYPSRMAGLLIAVPDGDAWRVVAAQYTSI